MRKLHVIIIFCFAMVIPTLAHAEYYKVYVKRVDQDLYKANTGLYIQTRYCYEYAYGDDAVLKYEQYAYDNKLIFSSNTICDVVKIFQ